MRKYFNSESSVDQKRLSHNLFFHENTSAYSNNNNQQYSTKYGNFKADTKSSAIQKYQKHEQTIENYNITSKLNQAQTSNNSSFRNSRCKETPSSIGLDFRKLKNNPLGVILQHQNVRDQHVNVLSSTKHSSNYRASKRLLKSTVES